MMRTILQPVLTLLLQSAVAHSRSYLLVLLRCAGTRHVKARRRRAEKWSTGFSRLAVTG